MSRVIIFSAVFLIFALLSTPASAASKRPVDVWNYYHFDGSAFAPGPAVDGTAFVAVQQKVQPVVLTAPTEQIEHAVLPDGSGVIAGICYLQSAGGKLGTGRGFKPFARVPLLISSADKQRVSVQTDDHGYFVVVLPAGTYSVASGPFTADVTVERGITTLVPLRGGKRMVD
jgi:hypothetical protein